ncbi:MAG: hypothetical protein FJZ90_07560 [Chloroflexi bacterium]|nr:hypothetical protein [Chloroflexota bacterium]
MQFRRAATFRKDFEDLSTSDQRAARRAFEFLKDNPQYPYHPSLRIKPIQGYERIWEGHVTREVVFTFQIETDPETNETVFVFRRIGRHDIYGNP